MIQNFTVTNKQRIKIESVMSELKRQLRNEDGIVAADPKEIYSALHGFVYGDMSGGNKNSFLGKVPGAESLAIEACNGTKTFADEDGIFNRVNKNIHRANVRHGSATKEVFVKAYDMEKNVDMAEVFYSLSDNLEKLCLTEHQIIFFCAKHYSLLRIGTHSPPALFLRKKGKYFFTVLVFGNGSGGLSVREDRLRDGGKIWTTSVRVVVPVLTM